MVTGWSNAPYFNDSTILPIPELVAEVGPKTLSFIVTDLRTWRLAGLKKETFGELLRTTRISYWYYCQRSVATLNLQLVLEELAVKLAQSKVSTKYFQLQSEYRGQRRIQVTVCNVPVQLNGNVLAAYLSAYSSVEEVTPVRVADGIANKDYIFNVCLNREGFQVIPHIS